MSGTTLKKEAQRVLKELQRTAENSEKSARKAVVRQPGQILIVNKAQFFNNTRGLFPEFSDSNLENIWNQYTTEIRSLQKSVSARRLTQLMQDAKSNNLFAQGEVFYINKYDTFRRNVKGIKLKTLVEKELENIGKSADDSRIRLLGGSDNIKGSQIGHGDTGTGALPVSGVRAARAKQLVSKLSGGGKAKLSTVISKYEDTMNFVIDHEQLLTAKGNLRKRYSPVLIVQDSVENQTLKEMESAAIRQLEVDLQDIVLDPNSTPLPEAVAQVTLHNIAGKRRKNTRTSGKKASKIHETSNGSASKKRTRKTTAVVATDSGLPKTVRRKPQKSAAASPLALIGILNKELPRVVRENMGAPRLENQTGRFASSVRITDIATTAQGFPSIGYTYDRSIYETFEVGNRQGSVERDPRSLIDASIREIAAQYAIGRFYTRRV